MMKYLVQAQTTQNGEELTEERWENRPHASPQKIFFKQRGPI